MELRSILSIPAAYRLYTKMVAGEFYKVYVRDYVRPQAGDRVLDIGCGPGDILDFLSEVDYLGVDLSPKYIEAARVRFRNRGRFLCRPVEDLIVEEPASFDIVMANGVAHHLNDESALDLYRVAQAALKPTGRFVTVDGAFVDGQSPLARMILKRDRGKFIRSPQAYAALASRFFPEVKVVVRHDLLRFPFTHALLDCSPGGTLTRSVASIPGEVEPLHHPVSVSEWLSG
jgi:SAM-dependent methyltransferase